MIYACFSPSLFECSHNTDAVKSIAEEINRWIVDLKSIGVEHFFTNEYALEILSREWPWNTPEASRYLREIRIIISAQAKEAKHTSESFCDCCHSSSTWNDVLFTASQVGDIGIIARCAKSTIGTIPICRDKEAFTSLKFPPWICKIDEAHKNKIPLSGECFYSPPKNWNSCCIKCYWPQIDKTGYLDKDNRLWVWQDEEGGHWDVTPKKKSQYTRVGINGNVIDKKYKL